MRQPEWHDEVRLDTRVYGPWRSIHTDRVYGEAGIHGYSIHTALVGGPCLRAANTVNLDRAPVNMALCLGSGRTRYDTRFQFNVRSKADISLLNLPHGTNHEKVEKKKM